MKLSAKQLQNINFTRRFTLPILEYALITPEHITVTDMNAFYQVHNPGIPVPVESFLVGRKEFVKFYKKMGIDIISTEQTNRTVKFHTKKGMFALPSLEDISEFPTVPDMVGDIHMNIDADDLRMLLNFVSTDDLRPSMCGVFIDGVNMVATDGHTMKWMPHRFEGCLFTGTANTNDTTNRGVIIPSEAIKLLTESLYYLAQSKDKNYLLLNNREESIAVTKRDETYPNYGTVIPLPADDDIVVQVNKQVVFDNLTFCNDYGNKHTNAVKLELKDRHIVISSEDIDNDTEFRSKAIPVIIMKTNPTITIGFHGGYLEKCLKHTDSNFNSATIRMTAPNRCAIIDGDTLIMPILLT